MKERIYLLPKEGNFYKANLHCHTTISDGKLTPEQVKEEYQKNGYQIVAYTDHKKYCPHPELNSKDFLALAGLETDINEIRPGKERIRTRMFHINFYDTNPDEMPEEKARYCAADYWNYDLSYVNSYIKKMKKLGFLASYNHPYWSMQNYDEYTQLEGLFAMEIYNHGCELDGLYGYNPQAYDEMLRSGKKIFCLASDDNHNEYPFGHPLCDSFGGFTMIKAKELTYPAVMKALEKGDFYSSMGPIINSLYIEGNELVVETSPVQKIYVKMEGKNCYMKVAPPGERIKEARFTLTGREGFIRVACRTEKGNFANSNAYFLEDIPIDFTTE
ncbi:PHP domain-containing protein [Lachnoclostridium phytofermentans]|uniref:PHP domain protein n=1 Tax=Lachnoclostridium phytofermentans (strain ATCC 700394 / DSM 18823 / ISDg) TaxID=357809 RepID=A9KQ71_LACP7|nr:PHP domain-containing protein [Lachnoclostridium phytofermentans]ABX43383.1 PHP domain protein [Lachnoclostridium phytofermentans ISDg]